MTTFRILVFCLSLASVCLGAAPPSPTLQLYRELGTAGLDAKRIFHVRDVDLDLEDIHLSLEDGTLGFLEPVDGHVTGAFFEGQGELLIIPPDNAERASLALFTKSAVLEEQFTSAYLRFDDKIAAKLAADVRPEQDVGDFVARWDPAARSLASADALRLLLALSNPPASGRPAHLLHARLSGVKLGTFDVMLDSSAPEQVSVAQAGYTGYGALYYDVWMSFPMRSTRQIKAAGEHDPIHMADYKLRVHVLPSHEIEAQADASVVCEREGMRVLLFELSRYLKVREVTLAGAPVEFIQNEAIAGSELARRGNDVMAVVLPRPLHAGESMQLHFSYAGSVISDAGGGLMYVGARGSWYPNRGPMMASFEMEFRYPLNLTLVATGARTALKQENGEQVAAWKSDKAMPFAGFNLGHFTAMQAKVDGTEVATYSATVPMLAADGTLSAALPSPGFSRRRPLPENVGPSPAIAPVQSSPQPLERQALATINFLSPLWGAYPYSTLSLTPLPGHDSQGWPTLIYLSDYCFLPDSARPAVPSSDAAYERLLFDQLMPAHEIAHQWWGDNILWSSYHDQWIMESLANYSALMEIGARDPRAFKSTMERYRDDLLRPATEHGPAYTEAGPVTLGARLSSSRFPAGYDRVLYERGAWLMYMLHSVISGKAAERAPAADDPFMAALRAVQREFAGKTLSTAELERALEKNLPEDVRYEGKASLDWFFDSWVNGNSVPRLELRDVKLDHRSGTASGTLVQADAAKDLVTLVPIYAERGGNEPPVLLKRLFADGDETSFKLKLPAGATKLVIDPYNTILRRQQ
jgi:hypothetical protein